MERIPLTIPDLRGREIEFLSNCVQTNWVSTAGPQITDFENVIKSFVGSTYAVSAVNGTCALHLALMAAGVGPGDLVIVPDWTFAASINAIYHAGALPYFHDISRDWSLDPESVAETLATKDTRIKAVLAVHPLGRPADIENIRRYCEKYDVALIEDAAGALGATYKGKKVGTFGHLAVFSFNGNKVITAGGGGMITTNDKNLAQHVRHISTQARLGNDYSHDAVGWNYRMTNLNAALGLAQMERCDEMIAARHEIAKRYDEVLRLRTDILLPPSIDYGVGNAWLYNVLCADAGTATALVTYLQEQNIESRIFWRALSDQRPYANAPRRPCNRAKALSGRVVSLPSSSSLTTQQQDYILQVVSRFVGPQCHPIV